MQIGAVNKTTLTLPRLARAKVTPSATNAFKLVKSKRIHKNDFKLRKITIPLNPIKGGGVNLHTPR